MLRKQTTHKTNTKFSCKTEYNKRLTVSSLTGVVETRHTGTNCDIRELLGDSIDPHFHFNTYKSLILMQQCYPCQANCGVYVFVQCRTL
jgi:hypothetical protein